MKKKTNQKGFTLVEIIIVVVILAILAALISFIVGSMTLSALVLILRVSMPTPKMIADAPAWVWIGGSLGATYIATTN